MKLQNLIIIFIIIIIPIVFIFSIYLNLEIKTINLQTDYDTKLLEATKEAVEAFEINTTEWNSEYSTLANSKRQDLISSVNVFTTSLSDKLRIGGTSKENILTYVPAIVFTMYDGYYIYAPTYVPQTITNNNGVQLFYYKDAGSEGAKITASAIQNIGGTIVAGEPMYAGTEKSGTYNGETINFSTNIENAEKTYKHVLKTFVPYTSNYESNGDNYVINYTLDNYVRIYGKNESKEGYIIEDFGNTNIIEIPVNSDYISSIIKYNGKEIKQEILTENIYVKDTNSDEAQLKNYPYIYNSNNDKRYYDEVADKFFTLNNSNVKVYLPDTEVGTAIAEYKKILIRTSNTNWDYLELYQLLNGSDNTWYYKGINNTFLSDSLYQPNIGRKADCSAINYYVETASFNQWLKTNNINTEEILEQGTQAIIDNINNNLNLSLSNYSANSGIDYKLPELTDMDWEQALSNVSMIAFFQGKRIGLKTYNNYAVVTSNNNNEFVAEDSLYYITQEPYYHRYNCKAIENGLAQGAYRNTEFKAQSYTVDDETKYYYKHTTYGNNESGEKTLVFNYLECYDCIANRNNIKLDSSTDYSIKYVALARERYIQMQRTKLTR